MTLDDIIARSDQPVISPAELLKQSAIVNKVYQVASLIGKLHGDHEFELPPRSEMAKLCGCNGETINRAYDVLTQTGWMHVIDRGVKKSMRKLIRLKTQEPEISFRTRVREGTEMADSHNTKQRRGSSPIISITVKFQADDFLRHTYKTASKRDNNKSTLRDWTLEELWEQACRPSIFDLTHAILETESFDTARSKLNNVLSFFISRFDENGNLRPDRKGILPQSQTRKRKELFDGRGVAVSQEQCTCPIFPTPEIPAERIDDICRRLNAGDNVDVSEYPRFRNMDFIVEVYDDFRVRLAPIVKLLAKEKSGYWRVGRWKALEAIREGRVPQEEHVN